VKGRTTCKRHLLSTFKKKSKSSRTFDVLCKQSEKEQKSCCKLGPFWSIWARTQAIL